METYFTRAVIKIIENISWVHLLLVKDRINVNGVEGVWKCEKKHFFSLTFFHLFHLSD